MPDEQLWCSGIIWKSRTRSACTKQLCIFHEWALMTLQLYLIQFALVKEIFIRTPLPGWSDKRFPHSSVRGRCPDPGEMPIIFPSWTSVLRCWYVIQADVMISGEWPIISQVVYYPNITHLKFSCYQQLNNGNSILFLRLVENSLSFVATFLSCKRKNNFTKEEC